MDRRTLITATLAAPALIACTSSPRRAGTLLGRWQPTASQLGGNVFAVVNFRGAVLVLQPTTYEFGDDSGMVFLGLPGPPAQMDVQGKVGPNAGKTILTIYSLQQDELVICYQLGVGPRPTTFESPAGTQVLLVKYKRL